ISGTTTALRRGQPEQIARLADPAALPGAVEELLRHLTIVHSGLSRVALEDDLDRDAHRHLAFGFGVHQCLGQSLARTELQIALATLFRRLPGLHLAVPRNELRFSDGLFYGTPSLPVHW
ncbi:cytochrome P450, partial [Streptomyces goshikiensis]